MYMMYTCSGYYTHMYICTLLVLRDMYIATNETDHQGFAIIWDDESAEAWEAVMESIADAMVRVCGDLGFCDRLQFVMADGSPSISKMVAEKFPNAIRLMCWPHAQRRCARCCTTVT